MRNVRNTWKKKTTTLHLHKFNFDDISTFLFSEDSLEVTIYPFSDWNTSILRHIPVVFQINPKTPDYITVKDFVFLISKINRKKVNHEDVKKVSFIVVGYLYQYYLQLVSSWQDYFHSNIKEFCKSTISEIKWHEVKYSSDTGPKSDMKAIWLTLCAIGDREFWTNYAISLRESILPWLNAEMYKNYKDNKDNKRFNIEYDNQRLLMADGDMKSMDIPIPDDIAIQLKRNTPVSFKGASFEAEDLDEIKVGI